MKDSDAEFDEFLTLKQDATASSPEHKRTKVFEQELEWRLLHNAALREHIRHLVQVRTTQKWGNVLAACTPTVLLGLMYGTLIWVKPPAAVMQTLIICTFSSFCRHLRLPAVRVAPSCPLGIPSRLAR